MSNYPSILRALFIEQISWENMEIHQTNFEIFPNLLAINNSIEHIEKSCSNYNIYDPTFLK